MTDGEAPDAARFEALVAALRDLDPDLSSIAAAVLAACGVGIAADSRSFANRLGLAHAVVLREVNELIERKGMLAAGQRDPRTLRLFYELTTQGRRLVGLALPTDA